MKEENGEHKGNETGSECRNMGWERERERDRQTEIDNQTEADRDREIEGKLLREAPMEEEIKES